MRTPRLPAVDSTDAPTDLNGLVRFAERRNLVSVRVPSHFKRSLPVLTVRKLYLNRHSVIARAERDGTRAQTRFRLSPKRTSPFKSVGGRQFSRLLAAEVCTSALVMLDRPRSEVT